MTGIAGTVVIDPATPVCMVGRTCSAPDGNDTLIFWRGSYPAAKARTSAAGTFRIALPPGTYRVTFPRRATFRARVPSIRVTKGAYTRVHLAIDIGIR